MIRMKITASQVVTIEDVHVDDALCNTLLPMGYMVVAQGLDGLFNS